MRSVLLVVAGLLADGACAGATTFARVHDAAGAPLRDAAVYLVPATRPARASPPARAVLEQRDREFIPFVTVVRTGTSVTFPNRDQLMHHVYSFEVLIRWNHPPAGRAGAGRLHPLRRAHRLHQRA